MHIAHSNRATPQLANSFLTSQRLEYRATHEKRGVTTATALSHQEERTKGTASRFIRGCGSVALALLVGTGGVATPNYVAAREDKGYRLLDIKYSERKDTDTQRAKPRTSAENLAFVRNTLKPPVTELASFFGVSRQAIYNWQAGEPISAHNEALLQQLADATTLLHRENLTGSSSLIKRRLPGGKTLLEQMQGGEPGESVAKALIAMFQTENQQHSRVAHRLRGRSAITPIDPSDAGTPHLNEQA